MDSRHVAGGHEHLEIQKNTIFKGFSNVHLIGGHHKNIEIGGFLMPQETKNRIPLWLYPNTIEMVDKVFPEDNCKSRSEFIEKAVRFYCGYISADKAVQFLPAALVSSVSAAVQSSENRIARLLFKLAVEMSMTMNVVAAGGKNRRTRRRILTALSNA